MRIKVDYLSATHRQNLQHLSAKFSECFLLLVLKQQLNESHCRHDGHFVFS